jgi:hypothetical protein
MSTDAFDKVSSIIGNAMNDAWTRIITDLADVAKGSKPVTNLLVGPTGTLSLDEVKGFFAVAGGANMDISFPCVMGKQPIGLFRASCVDHGIPTKFAAVGGPSVTGISGSISIGVGISF